MSSNLQELCSQSRTAMREGNTSKAIDLAERALRLDASQIDVFAVLGGIARASRNWKVARDLMQRDYDEQRMSSGWMLRYAEVLVENADIQSAMDIVSAVYQKDRKAQDGYARIGYVFRRHHQPHRAASIMQRDVDLERISPLWEIRYYRILAESGRKETARAQVELFCKRHEKNRIGWSAWLETVQQSFHLGINLDTESILERALQDHPEDTEAILFAFGEVFQKNVLVNWMAEKGQSALMSGKRSAALKAPQNQWSSVARFYNRLIDKGIDPGAAGELWKAARAELFIAENHLLADDRQAAEATVCSLLRIIDRDIPADDAKKSADALLNGIGHPDGRKFAACLIERIPAAPSGTWIALADTLQWFGFFREGVDAYERSIRACCRNAEKPQANAAQLQPAFRAATLEGDYERALHYANRLPASAAADACRYLSLHGVKHGRNVSCGRSEAMIHQDPFFHYLKDKSVAIVGPAPTGEACGREIDSYDVVIRTCYTGSLPGDPAEFGSRTDGSNYAKLVSLQWEHETHRPDYLQEIDLYTFSPVLSKAAFLHEDIQAGKARRVWFNPHFYHKYPNAIQRLIYDVLQYPTGPVKIFKSNFFLSSTSYTKQYLRPDYTDSSDGKCSRQMPFRQTLLYGHDLLCQLAFVRNLWKAGILEADEACRRVLELSNAQYMQRIEELHGA